MPPARPPATRRRTGGSRAGLLVLAVAAVALNLRAPVAGIGPVLEEISAATGLSPGGAGVLTSLPVLAFACVGLASPWLARRLGTERAIAAAMAVLAVALATRVTGGAAALLVGTLVACAGIAAVNVLLPVVVKTWLEHRVGLVTGLYTAVMSGGSALAAAGTEPLASAVGAPGSGWRLAVGVWAVPAAVALGIWLAAFGHRRSAGPAPGVPVAGGAWGLLGRPVVWALTVFFGTQSLLFYALLGWLPEVYRDAGIDPRTAGAMLSVCVLVGVPAFLVVPMLAARSEGQRAWALGLTAAAAVGLGGLLVAPAEGAWVWAVLLGVGNAAFPLALSLFALRTRDPGETATVSAVGQSLGYLLAAAGPLTVGLLREQSGSWTAPLVLLLAVMAVQAAAGLVAGRRGHA